MRGEIHMSRLFHGAQCGFIPPCARNTGTYARHVLPFKVHPRMRGEYFFLFSYLFMVIGSSPHARGIPCRDQPEPVMPRFIPACAGNTGVKNGTYLSFEVHPRMRGEYLSSSPSGTRPKGSSPHARGILYKVNVDVDTARFIPACAGNTSMSMRRLIII